MAEAEEEPEGDTSHRPEQDGGGRAPDSQEPMPPFQDDVEAFRADNVTNSGHEVGGFASGRRDCTLL